MRRKKNIVFYGVSLIKDPNRFLCITVTRQEATQYIIRHLKILKLEHFNAWCQCHNLDKNDNLVWLNYLKDVVTSEEKKEYTIKKIAYSREVLAAFLRMFGGCLPLGCTFDLPLEYDYFDSKMKSMEKLLSNPTIKDEILKSLDDCKKIWE